MEQEEMEAEKEKWEREYEIQKELRVGRRGQSLLRQERLKSLHLMKVRMRWVLIYMYLGLSGMLRHKNGKQRLW